MPFLEHAGARLYWRVEGAPDRPPVVLLPSLGTDQALWDRAAAHLLPRFRILRLDMRGQGASDGPPVDYSLRGLSEDVLAVMEEAGMPRAALCGVSLGGMVALEMAIAAPHRVSALIASCVAIEVARGDWDARAGLVRERGMAAVAPMALERLLPAAFRGRHPDIAETVLEGLLRANPHGYAGGCAAIRDLGAPGRLQAVAAPALIISGRDDAAAPTHLHGAQMARTIPGAALRILPTGHLPCLEAPSLFAGVVADFLLGGPGGTALDGEAARRRVLGDSWVDRSIAEADPFNAEFVDLITRYAWGEIWTRQGLDSRTRSLLVLVATAALGRWEEFRLHVRAGVEGGRLSEDDVKEVLLQLAVYAGVPAANTGFSEAIAVLRGQ